MLKRPDVILRNKSEKQRKAVSKFFKGKKHTKEHIEKMRLSKLGKKASLKTKNQMSKSQLNRWENSRELKEKLSKKMMGEKNRFWRGGKVLNGQGYIMVRINGKYFFEHRLIWEKFHNQSLPKGYIIHHLNGVRTDNRPENLVAMSRAEHIDQTQPFRQRILELEKEIEILKRK